ncbi:MAG: SDR family oxidoreductase [Ignavibacteriales bacterium]|nr:SDR family oxidoreductase [Ignavibacteriales bacterium]
MISRTVLVTGGTGSVGESIVRAFSAKGYAVTFQYLSNEPKAKILSQDTRATPIRLDFLSDFDLPPGGFDIVVNNAGINITSCLSHEVSIESWERTMKVNLFTPFQIVRSLLPEMMRKGWGRIINISSIYGLRGVEWNLPYNSSKHGLSGLTKTVAKEYAQYGITCNEICPGAISSDLMNRIATREGEQLNQSADDYLSEVAAAIPAKRLAKPQEIASLAIYLASEEAGYINGASITVDGGLVA